MKRNLYALLVGIDEYPNPNQRLQGCVNDINAVKEYLAQWSASDNYQLHIQTLLDQKATREGIIQGFRTHLSQAHSNDVVLFYYSGHGSQENNIPEAFWRFEPDRKNETLYCYDSGLPGKWHLADKELAKLIAQVALNKPHVCVILDCCHSGSGTKDPSSEVVERLTPGDERSRPLESYLFKPEELEQLCSDSSAHQSATGWEFPRGQHILMAACEDRDTAKEVVIDGKKRGIFSYCLLETLKQPGKRTYRELWQQTKHRVSLELAKLSRTQFPQLEVTPAEQGNLLFLDGAIAERASYFTVRHDKGLGWVIDGGAVHGVQPPAGEETTLLALFQFGCNVRDLQNPDQSIGDAKVTKVLPQLSQLEITRGTLSTDSVYKAIVISLPLPAHGVYIEGDAKGVALAERAIQSATMGNHASIYIRPVQTREEAQLRLQCRNQEYGIRLKDDDRSLVAPLQGYTADNAKRAIARLEHIARWLTIRNLSSPPASRIQPGDVEIEFLFEGENRAITDKKIRRQYQLKGGEWHPPKCTIKLTNKSQKALYCTILDLTDRFAIVAPFFAAGYVRLEPGQSAWASDGDYIDFSIEPELRELGLIETNDILKLIVSSVEFDAQLSAQDALDQPHSSHRGIFKQTTLNRLMDRAQSRLAQPKKEVTYDDWYTQQITFTTAL